MLPRRRRLQKLLALSRADRALLCHAFSLVLAVRLRLWARPFAANRALLGGPLSCRTRLAASPERVTWAIRAAARGVPRATCLTQALAGRRLLARTGRESRVVLGVAKAGAAMRAHAWLEYEGRPLLGGAFAPEFVLLPAAASERSASGVG